MKAGVSIQRSGVRILLAVLLLTAPVFAQRQMTAAQLTGFVKSSVEQHINDKDIADLLKRTHVTEKIDPSFADQIQRLGAGPRTMMALREVIESSATLPDPAAAPPKPAPRPVTLPDADTQQKLLAAIREYSMSYTQGLPDFICSQVTRQQVDPTGSGDSWHNGNKFLEQLTYFEHHEQYKVVMINGQMAQNKDHDKLDGAISSGEFGSMLYEIFAPETEAEFQYERPGKFDGRLMHVFTYRVPQSRSRYKIEDRNTGRSVIAGYHGRIWARQDNNAVMHITLECEEIPADFPIKDVKLEMWYDVIKISEQEFVLPLKWELKSREGKYLSWNSAELTNYRKYSADATITFDSNDVPDSKTKEEPVTPPVKKKQ